MNILEYRVKWTLIAILIVVILLFAFIKKISGFQKIFRF